MVKKTNRGGRRNEAAALNGKQVGRPADFGELKEQRSVALTPSCWAFIEQMAKQGQSSKNSALEQIIRAHPGFTKTPGEE